MMKSYVPHGLNIIENFSDNYFSNSYSIDERNAFNFFGINIDNGSITDPGKYDASITSPSFMLNYNLVMKAENENANSNVVQQLKVLKKRRDQNKSNTITILENKYNNLTSALKQYQTDEKQVWQNLNTAKDSNFMKKRESYLIQQKLDRLKEERNTVFQDLVNDYDNITKNKGNLLKLNNRNMYVTNFQDNLNKNNKNKLNSIEQDTLTKRRQAQIDIDRYHRQNNQIYYLKITFIFVLIAMIPIILGINDILFTKSSASITSGVVIIIAILLFIMRYIDNRNRSKLLWQERDFNGDFEKPESGDDNNMGCQNNSGPLATDVMTEESPFQESENTIEEQRDVQTFW